MTDMLYPVESRPGSLEWDRECPFCGVKFYPDSFPFDWGVQCWGCKKTIPTDWETNYDDDMTWWEVHHPNP